MTLMEAKVEAALCSRLSSRKYFVIHNTKEDEYYLTTTEPTENPAFKNATPAVTWFEQGCELGKGIHKAVTKWDAEPKKKRTAKQIIDELGNVVEKPKRVKQSTELAKLSFKSLEDAAKSEESGLFEFKGKQWAVSVRGSWVLHKHIMEAIKDGGLVLVVRGQGWYNYPKSMWTEFKGIFDSTSYAKGSYSQSILPKKFEKYFTQFKTK